jgi:hypothetical protein
VPPESLSCPQAPDSACGTGFAVSRYHRKPAHVQAGCLAASALAPFVAFPLGVFSASWSPWAGWPAAPSPPSWGARVPRVGAPGG